MNLSLTKKILIKVFLLVFGQDLRFCVMHFLSYFDKLRKKSGISYSIKYYKAVKLHITRYMCGQPLLSNSAGVGLTLDGFPSKFLYLKTLLDNRHFRIVLTFLTYTRSIKPTKKELKGLTPDYSSITDPYKGKNWTIPAYFIKDFVNNYNLHLDRPVYSDED